jgi:hypothetical protein
MFSDQEMQEIGDQLLAGGIESALSMAAVVDDLDEADAVMALAASMLSENPPVWLLATATAALAVRMHRTRKLDATLNSREPGPSPA